MKLSPSIEALIEGLRHLPGVGPKSAQRMTLHLLERDREGAQEIADAISVEQIHLSARPGEMRETLADIRKAKAELTWKPKVDIIEWINRQL